MIRLNRQVLTKLGETSNARNWTSVLYAVGFEEGNLMKCCKSSQRFLAMLAHAVVRAAFTCGKEEGRQNLQWM